MIRAMLWAREFASQVRTTGRRDCWSSSRHARRRRRSGSAYHGVLARHAGSV
jgi:hypothetical protein